MHGIILLADYFEDSEAIITIDLLRRAQLDIDLVSITESYNLITQSGLNMKAEKLISEINIDKYDFLVIPGGKAVGKTHLSSEITKQVVLTFNKSNKLIATICAAPSILGKYGLLDNKKYTCFPGFEKYIEKGILEDKKCVVQTNNFITAKAAGSTFLFAYEIIKYLINEQTANDVLKGVYY